MAVFHESFGKGRDSCQHTIWQGRAKKKEGRKGGAGGGGENLMNKLRSWQRVEEKTVNWSRVGVGKIDRGGGGGTQLGLKR